MQVQIDSHLNINHDKIFSSVKYIVNISNINHRLVKFFADLINLMDRYVLHFRLGNIVRLNHTSRCENKESKIKKEKRKEQESLQKDLNLYELS